MRRKKRIGTMLVEQGQITRQQLDRALQAQLLAGGHLGTSLIELGFIDEDGLAQALGQALNMRHTTCAAMDSIAPAVLGLLDAQTVERFRVVPIGRGYRSLHVAVVTPRDVASLSSRTGHRMIPWIAPEISVLEAMERYYGIPRPRRFVMLSGARARAAPLAGFELPPTLSPLEQAALHASLPTPVGGDVAVAAAAAPFQADLPAEAIAPLALEFPQIETDDLFGGDEATQALDSIDSTPRCSFEQVCAQLSNADDRSGLASILLDYAMQHMPGSILFGVRDAAAYVWDWRGMALAPEGIAGLEFPVDRGSVFQLLRGEPYYLGSVPSNAHCLEFFEALERPVPHEVLLLPIHLNDGLVAVLYGEGTGEWGVAADIEDYLQLASKISMALNIVILKTKIRTA